MDSQHPERLNPHWIVGFIDGEGCFSVSFSKREKFRLGLEVRASFSVSQKSHSRSVLDQICTELGCGSVRYSAKDDTWKYETRDIRDITEKIIPFFQKYPLLTNKRNDFALFVEICNLIRTNHHLSRDGLIDIINLATQMNSSGTRKYSREQLLDMVRKA